jgi:hypothetical protein
MICTCGAEMEWHECSTIGCEEGFIDEYEDDPINYSPGEEYARCATCDGEGGWWQCTNPSAHHQAAKAE